MTSAFAVRKHVYESLVTMYPTFEVYFGWNIEKHGFDFIEVYSIEWDVTEYSSGGFGGYSSQNEEYSIEVAITCSQNDGSLLDTFDRATGVYAEIDEWVKSDPSFGGLVFVSSQCSPAQELSVYEGSKKATTLVFGIECKNNINNV